MSKQILLVATFIFLVSCLLVVTFKTYELELELKEKNRELEYLQNKLNRTQTDFLRVKRELNYSKEYLRALNENYYILKKNPNYEEVERLLESEYLVIISKNKPLCTHFSFMYWRYLTEHGIFSSPTALYLKSAYGNSGHMILAFNTSDRGIIYYDPSVDKFVNITLNEYYFIDNNIDNSMDYLIDYVNYWNYTPKYNWRRW